MSIIKEKKYFLPSVFARIRRSFLFPILSLFFFFPFITLGASFTVSTTTDELDSGAVCITGSSVDCSLREAIAAANADTSGDHTIVIPAGIYVIGLLNTSGEENVNATGDFDITNTAVNITLTGDGTSETIIDGNDVDRIFDIVPSGSSTKTYTIEQMTVQNGQTDTSGGGIRVRNGNCILSFVDLKNNTLTATSGDGAGLYFRDVLRNLYVENSTFSQNEALATNAAGGGIFLFSTNASAQHVIKNSTFDHNTTHSFGAAIDVYQLNGTLDFLQNTVVENTSISNVGAIRLGSPGSTGVMNAQFSTFVFDENTVGLNLQGGVGAATLRLTANIVSGSNDGCDVGGGNIIESLGYNREETTSDCSAYFTDPSDMTGATIGLGTLSDTGGSTKTIPFTDYTDPNNDAVDVMLAADCTNLLGSGVTDQRGVERGDHGDCDIGSHEANTVDPTLTMNGEENMLVECANVYSDAGANAVDDFEGSLSVSTSGAVNFAIPGIYALLYESFDSDGNAAVSATRNVTVQDTIAPTITLLGSDVVLEKGEVYNDPGATAVDSCDSTISVTSAGVVDTEKIGTYEKTYTAQDDSGNTAQKKRTVTVVDSTPIMTTDGQYVRVTVNGEIVEKKKIGKKKIPKKYYTLIQEKLYPSYETVAIVRVGKKSARLIVFRLMPNNELEKKVTKKILLKGKRTPHKIALQKKKKRVVLTISKGPDRINAVYRLTKKGKLKVVQ